jgi:predicted ribosomally synthesized peptide with SipW-like signal peptide
MKKILGLSLAALLIIGSVVGGTIALFGDTETRLPNVFTTGTIDLAVNGQNPWNQTFTAQLSDLKPSMMVPIAITLTNVGTNPMDVWMRITDVVTDGGADSYHDYASSEPEYAYMPGGGAFDVDGLPTGVGYVEKHNIDTMILIGLQLGDVNIDIAVDDFYVTAFDDGADGYWLYLGNLLAPDDPAYAAMPGTMKFMLDRDTGHWAQGDAMTFTIEFYAQQSEGEPIPEAPLTELPGFVR